MINTDELYSTTLTTYNRIQLHTVVGSLCCIDLIQFDSIYVYRWHFEEAPKRFLLLYHTSNVHFNLFAEPGWAVNNYSDEIGRNKLHSIIELNRAFENYSELFKVIHFLTFSKIFKYFYLMEKKNDEKHIVPRICRFDFFPFFVFIFSIRNCSTVLKFRIVLAPVWIVEIICVFSNFFDSFTQIAVCFSFQLDFRRNELLRITKWY